MEESIKRDVSAIDLFKNINYSRDELKGIGSTLLQLQ